MEGLEYEFEQTDEDAEEVEIPVEIRVENQTDHDFNFTLEELQQEPQEQPYQETAKGKILPEMMRTNDELESLIRDDKARQTQGHNNIVSSNSL